MIKIITTDELDKETVEFLCGFEISVWIEPIEDNGSTKFRNVKIEYFHRGNKKHEVYYEYPMTITWTTFEAAYFNIIRTAKKNVPTIHILRKGKIDELL